MAKQVDGMDDDDTVTSDLDGPNQIPDNMQPTIDDRNHGLNMPDGPVGNRDFSVMDAGNVLVPSADETEDEDANPPIKTGST